MMSASRENLLRSLMSAPFIGIPTPQGLENYEILEHDGHAVVERKEKSEQIVVTITNKGLDWLFDPDRKV